MESKIKFSIKLQDKKSNIFKKLMEIKFLWSLDSQALVFEWHMAFLSYWRKVEDEPCSDQLITSGNEEKCDKSEDSHYLFEVWQ